MNYQVKTSNRDSHQLVNSFLCSCLDAKEVNNLTFTHEAPLAEKESAETECPGPNPTEPDPDAKSKDSAPLEPAPVEENVVADNSDTSAASDNNLLAQTPALLENEVVCQENIPPPNRDDQ